MNTNKGSLDDGVLGESFRQAELLEKDYLSLRELGDVVKIKLPIIGKTWVTTSWASSSAMLKNDVRFTMKSSPSGAAAGIRWWMPNSLKVLAQNMLSSDDPQHRRLRHLVDDAFQRRNVQNMGENIESIAHHLLDSLSNQNENDLVQSYARRLPLYVIAELLGLPADKRKRFLGAAKNLSGVTGLYSFVRMLPAVSRMKNLLSDEIERQSRSNDSNGIIGDLLSVGPSKASLDQDELLAMLFLLLMAGHETTTHIISSSVLSLEMFPDQKSQFLSNTHGALAVEELLRYNSPVQYSKPRFVQEDGEFFGSLLKSGDLIMAGLGIANRDPRKFEQPDRLDLGRKPNNHLEFGTGVHFCLGLQLARLEIDTGLRVLYGRYPQLRISKPPIWNKTFGWRSLKELKVHSV